MNKSRILAAFLIGLSIVVSCYKLADSWNKTHYSHQTLAVTGLGTKDFTSDLIVWRANYLRNAGTLAEANRLMRSDHELVEKFIKEHNISASDISFSSVMVHRNYKTLYNQQGNVSGNVFDGYSLSQTVIVESKQLDRVEKMSSDISNLIEQGVECIAMEPEYYYTKLKDLKIELLKQATADALERAQTIAENAKSKLGSLKNANMGIFQITGQNSNEDYSWGGSFNTSAKNKSASITVKLEFDL
ncbi:MAG: SIMPL domain-containing protein [Bacteroidia bacterium]|jgi:hypothetical protein|nr:SIMPL domain-containing protein [Bacteroidia bacterium]